MSHIIKARVENIVGCKNFEIEPNGKSVTIGGRNGQGKTSAIAGLVMALRGKEEVPEKPVRDGAEKGEVEILLERHRVKLIVRNDRKTSLKVETLDGNIVSKPQEFLNQLFGNLSFDPGKFRAMKASDRVACLCKLIGFDLEAWKEKRREKFATRTEVNRNLERAKVLVDSSPIDMTLPAEERDASSARQVLSEAIEAEKRKAESQGRVAALEAKMIAASDAFAAKKKEIERLKAEHDRAIDEKNAIAREGKEFERLLMEERKACESIVVPDTRVAFSEVDRVEADNRRIRENRKNFDIHRNYVELSTRAKQLTAELDEMDAEQVRIIQKAALPIPGLGIEGDAVTYNGHPFDQISESQKWEVSTAISYALNPSGIVFLRESGGLDKEARERVRQRAAALDVQLFLEVVDDQEDVQILIEEGEIRENRITQE